MNISSTYNQKAPFDEKNEVVDDPGVLFGRVQIEKIGTNSIKRRIHSVMMP